MGDLAELLRLWTKSLNDGGENVDDRWLVPLGWRGLRRRVGVALLGDVTLLARTDDVGERLKVM